MRGSETVKKAFVKVIAACAVLGVVGYVVKAVTKNVKTIKNTFYGIALDIYSIRCRLEGREVPGDEEE